MVLFFCKSTQNDELFAQKQKEFIIYLDFGIAGKRLHLLSRKHTLKK